MRPAAAGWAGALVLALGLACAGGGDGTDEATDGTDEATDGTDEATDGGEEGDDDEGEEGGDPVDGRAARNDCRLGVKGVVVGIPGWRSGDHQAHKGPLQLRAAPRADGRVVGEIDRYGTLARPEPGGGRARAVCHWAERKEEPHCLRMLHDREAYGLPVYEERKGWVQVAVGPGEVLPVDGEGCRRRAWLQLDEPLEFLPAEALIEGSKFTHTLPNWDGVLYDGPDGAPRPSGEKGQVTFRWDRTARAGGRLWLEATLIDTHCDTKVERSKGWIPVTDRDGRLQVWFDNGC